MTNSKIRNNNSPNDHLTIADLEFIENLEDQIKNNIEGVRGGQITNWALAVRDINRKIYEPFDIVSGKPAWYNPNPYTTSVSRHTLLGLNRTITDPSVQDYFTIYDLIMSLYPKAYGS